MALDHYGRQRLYTTPQGLWLANVTRISGHYAYVRFENYNPGAEFKTLIAEGLHAFPNVAPADIKTTKTVVTGGSHGTHVYGETGDHTHPAHDHTYGRPLAVGDRVLCAFIQGRADVPVILARLAG